MNKRKALGKGLNALLSPQTDSGGDEVQHIDINAIDTNPYQPRMDFDNDEIAGLAESIQKQGLLQPIVLRKAGDRYQIISGERRFRAFKHLRRGNIPCIIKTSVTDNEMLELALVENIQREQLNEIEKAIAYQKLIQQLGYTHDNLAKQVGKSRAAITNTLRLLNLPEEVQQMLRANELQMGHARAILSIEGAENQLEAARKIVEGKLTVREAEMIGRDGVTAEDGTADASSLSDKSRGKSAKTQKQHSPDTIDALEKLQYKFGTPVKLKEMGSGKGRLEIEYFSDNDLLRVFDLLLGGN